MTPHNTRNTSCFTVLMMTKSIVPSTIQQQAFENSYNDLSNTADQLPDRYYTQKCEQGTPPKGIMDVNWAIHCGDRIPRTNNYEEIPPALRKQYSTSYFVGGTNAVTQSICAQWPWKAKEVYQSDFKAKTRHPILVMSNSLDGQTPLVSARNMSSGFEGAVILENDGVGHGAFSFPSTCIAKHVMDYWVDGLMPANGTICNAEFGAFEKKTWFELLASMENGTVVETKAISARKWLEEQV